MSKSEKNPARVSTRQTTPNHGNVGLCDDAVNPIYRTERQGQFAESAKLEQAIKANLKGLGYGE